jgi:hypothetical protein
MARTLAQATISFLVAVGGGLAWFDRLHPKAGHHPSESDLFISSASRAIRVKKHQGTTATKATATAPLLQPIKHGPQS